MAPGARAEAILQTAAELTGVICTAHDATRRGVEAARTGRPEPRKRSDSVRVIQLQEDFAGRKWILEAGKARVRARFGEQVSGA